MRDAEADMQEFDTIAKTIMRMHKLYFPREDVYDDPWPLGSGVGAKIATVALPSAYKGPSPIPCLMQKLAFHLSPEHLREMIEYLLEMEEYRQGIRK